MQNARSSIIRLRAGRWRAVAFRPRPPLRRFLILSRFEGKSRSCFGLMIGLILSLSSLSLFICFPIVRCLDAPHLLSLLCSPPFVIFPQSLSTLHVGSVAVALRVGSDIGSV